MKHKLDSEVEDILQHYGIKGMRWDVRRTAEEIAADAQAGVDAMGEQMDNNDLSDLMDNFGDKFKDSLDDASKTASKILKLTKLKMKDIRIGFSLKGKSIFKTLEKRSRDRAYNKAERQNELLREYLRTNGKPDKRDLANIAKRNFAAERDLRGYVKTQKNKRATTVAKQYNDEVSGNKPSFMNDKNGKRKQVRKKGDAGYDSGRRSY